MRARLSSITEIGPWCSKVSECAVVQAVVLIAAVVVLTANLIVDLSYAIIDPHQDPILLMAETRAGSEHAGALGIAQPARGSRWFRRQ